MFHLRAMRVIEFKQQTKDAVIVLGKHFNIHIEKSENL